MRTSEPSKSAQLAEQRCRELEEELAEAARHQEEFLTLLAHELRGPLAPIRNAVYVLRQCPANPQAREWAEDVLERQVTHLAHLVDDLVDVSRLRRGKVVLRKQRLDLVTLVRQAVEDQRGILAEAGLTLELNLPPVPLWLEGDATRLSQVLGNLLSNARQFTPRGGRVAVSCLAPGDSDSCPPGASPCAQVHVRDTGVGLTADLLPRVFDIFTQAESSLARTSGGLGLGLALVRGLVELHGGRVTASSEGPDQGAEFTFWLPVERGTIPEADTNRTRDLATQKGRRVLLVEDNRDGAETLRALLQMLGHEVALAYTGTEGVQLARQFRPEVVFCDIGLPGMDGFAVGRALRQHPSTARSRLIVLSGYGQEEDRRKSREAGFDLHLTKPIDPQELRQLLA